MMPSVLLSTRRSENCRSGSAASGEIMDAGDHPHEAARRIALEGGRDAGLHDLAVLAHVAAVGVADLALVKKLAPARLVDGLRSRRVELLDLAAEHLLA